MHAQFQSRQRRLAQSEDVGARLRLDISAGCHRQHLLLRIGDQPIAVHRDRIFIAQETEVATFAMAIVSNARFTNGNGSASIMSAGVESSARTSISFVPQPAGIIPTPTSTRPM